MLGNHMLLLKNPVLDSILIKMFKGFPKGSAVKNSPANAGDTGLIPGSEDPLEKEMATHSRILAWEIPWTEEPGRLQSMDLKSQTQLSN